MGSNEKDLRKQRKVEATVNIDSTGLATSDNQTNGDQKTQLVNSSNEEIGTALKPIYVNVVNQIDFTTIESLLTEIKTFAENIDNNTDQLEAKVDAVKTSIDNGFSVNHTDLLNIITELQGIDANTDNLETQLIQVISNTTGLATEATLTTRLSKADFEARINTLGQKTMANSTPVVIASDNIVKTTEDLGSNENHATVVANTVSVLLIAANTTRKEVIIYNDSNKQMSICPFTPAVYGTGFIVPSKTGWVIDTTQSALYGIWDTGATGNARIQEIYE